MKKLISGFICFNLFAIQSAFAQTLFKDELAEKLDKNLKIEYKKQPIIEDDFALKTLNQNLKVKKVLQSPIEDNLAKNLKPTLKINKTPKTPIEDILVLKLKGEDVGSKFEESKIKIAPLNLYTTKRNLHEGDWIDFILAQDIKFKKTMYKKGTIIKARVETLSQNSAYGVPADLIIGNFTLPNKYVLNGTITKQGANRAIWVYPTGYILSFFFFVGLPIFAIRGGHAKLHPEKVYEIEI